MNGQRSWTAEVDKLNIGWVDAIILRLRVYHITGGGEPKNFDFDNGRERGLGLHMRLQANEPVPVYKARVKTGKATGLLDSV